MDERLLDVNEHGVLRIPGTLWMSLVLLARYWVFSFAALFSAQNGGGAGLAEVFIAVSSWWPLIGQLPAVLLIFAGGRRLPEAGNLARTLWRRGQFLVAITVCLNLAWTAWALMQSEEWHFRPELVLVCFSILDLAIGWSLCSTKYAKQLFAEFPKRGPVLNQKS